MKNKIPIVKTSGTADVPARLQDLNKSQLHAVLATDSSGQPYTSLVAFALTADSRKAIIATPKDSNKYRNMLKNRNVSLMIDTRSNNAGDRMRSEALTLLGDARPVRKGRKRDELSGTIARKHPGLSAFIHSPSTALVLITIKKAIHAGNFQVVTEWSPDS